MLLLAIGLLMGAVLGALAFGWLDARWQAWERARWGNAWTPLLLRQGVIVRVTRER